MNTTTNELREGFRFFAENAGYIVGRRAIGALALARAENALRAAIDDDTARVRWVEDEDFDYEGWAADELVEEGREKFASGEWQARGCILERKCPMCGQWSDAASLWGIVSTFDSSDTYPRVVEAEMALEAF